MRFVLNVLFCCLLCLGFGLLEAEPLGIKKFEKKIEDSLITTKIMAKFAENKLLNPLKISVSTQEGVVKLRGNVKDKQIFVEVLRLAKSVSGVTLVDTEDLAIEQVNTVLTDAYITARVEAAVLKAKVFDDESIPIVGINAKTSNGIVTLTGEVKKNQSIAYIIKRVNAIRGVKKIISRLAVRLPEK